METRILATIFAVMVSVVAMATEKPKTNVQTINSDQVLVTVQADQDFELEVSITDEIGSIVYYKKSKKPLSKYNKIYDLENLRNGDYSMELKVDNVVTKRDLKISSSNVFIGDSKEYSTPYFSLSGDQLIVTHLNFDNERYKMKIYGEQGTVHESFLEKSIPINAGFDLSKLEAGKYAVVLSSQNHQFDYTFKK